MERTKTYQDSSARKEQSVLILYVAICLWAVTPNRWLPFHAITDHAAVMTTNERKYSASYVPDARDKALVGRHDKCPSVLTDFNRKKLYGLTNFKVLNIKFH